MSEHAPLTQQEEREVQIARDVRDCRCNPSPLYGGSPCPVIQLSTGRVVNIGHGSGVAWFSEAYRIPCPVHPR